MSPGKPSKTVGPEWADLGDRLRDRRLDLARFVDPDFANLSAFCRNRGIKYRTAADLEHHRRDNYGRGILLEAELAYGLARGSVQQALAGGEFEPAPGMPPVTPPVRRRPRPDGGETADDPEGAVVADLLPPAVAAHWGNPYVRRFWESTRDKDINQDLRVILAEDLAGTEGRNGSGASVADPP